MTERLIEVSLDQTDKSESVLTYISQNYIQVRCVSCYGWNDVRLYELCGVCDWSVCEVFVCVCFALHVRQGEKCKDYIV